MNHLAAPLFMCLCLTATGKAQVPVRTRDAAFAVVKYDNGLSAGAMTLYDATIIATDRTTRAAFGLVSIFGDGRLSMQAGIEGARRTAAIPIAPRFAPLFAAARGEVSLDAATTIQSGYMPTAHVTGRSRLRLESAERGAHVGAAVARAFDGRLWQTVVMGELHAFARRGTMEGSITSTPMQVGIGDVLADTEGRLSWARGAAYFGAALGVRYGEAVRGATAWGNVSATWSIWRDLAVTANLGSYPADLVQNLPAGRFLGVGLRLPGGRLPPFRRPPPPAAPAPPRTPDLPVTARLAMVVGPALDSTGIREIKVWAPGARVVEVMADFVDWIPVPLIRQPGGEWQGYYRVPAGLHRVNIRVDGGELDAPVNWPLERDEFTGTVALVIVR